MNKYNESTSLECAYSTRFVAIAAIGLVFTWFGVLRYAGTQLERYGNLRRWLIRSFRETLELRIVSARNCWCSALSLSLKRYFVEREGRRSSFAAKIRATVFVGENVTPSPRANEGDGGHKHGQCAGNKLLC